MIHIWRQNVKTNTYSKYISGSAEKERVKYILRSNDSEFRGTKPSGKCKKGSHGLILVETLANTLNNEPPTKQIHMNHQQNKYIWYPERGISNTYDTLKGVSQIYSKYISGSAEKERVAWFEWIYSEYWKYSDKVPPTKHEHYVYRVQLVVSKRDLQITDEARNSPFICWRATVFMEDASHVTSSTYHLPANCHTPTCLHLNIHNGQ